MGSTSTIRFPRLDAIEPSPASNAKVIPRLSNRLTVLLHLLGIRLSLDHAGHHEFLYRVDADTEGRWTIHLFFADRDAIPLVPSLTNGIVGPAERPSVDAQEFVEQRLEHLKNMERLTGSDPWWDHDRAQAA